MILGTSEVITEERLPKMDQWAFNPHGLYLLEAERDALETVLPKLFGYHLLQIGGPVKHSLIDSSVIDHHIRLSKEHSPGFEGVSVIGDPYHIPFIPETIDVIVMPHILDYLNYPAQVIKSVYDTLIPEGTVIIIGVNPCSLWGLAKLCHTKDLVYRHAHLKSKSHIVHLLKNQGFEIIKRKTLCFRWPSSTSEKIEHSVIMEPFGQLIMPSFGGVYMIVARKKVEKMIAIMPKLKKAFAIHKKYAKPIC